MINVTATERAHFTLSQATAMLPLLRLIVADIRLAHRELSERRLEFHRLLRRSEGKTSQWHDDEVEETRADLQTESRQLDAYIIELEKLGVTLRSAEEGVINFPTKIDGQLAFYVWKLGEMDIAAWHGVDESFSDRKPLSVYRS